MTAAVLSSLHAPPLGVLASRGEAGFTGGIFEQREYLDAAARHEGTRVRMIGGDAVLPLLERPGGALRTVYGYPHPLGPATALPRLVEELVSCRAATVSPSPLGAGASLAAALGERLEPLAVRPICVAELAEDPLEFFAHGPRKKVERALRGGAEATVGSIEPWFGGLYRADMDRLGADDLYRFADGYFRTLAAIPSFQVTVRDAAGVAAAAVFLHLRDEATYHLSARRGDPAPTPGAVNLVLLEGLREARRRGAAVAILGGGRSLAEDDALFAFKRGMATDVVLRPTFRIGEASP